jgi:hypothetical protein
MTENSSHDSHLNIFSDTTGQTSRRSSTSPSTSGRHLRVAFPIGTYGTNGLSSDNSSTLADSECQEAADGHSDAAAAASTDSAPQELAWSDRMKHFTWTWYTLTMATGGVVNVLHEGMHRVCHRPECRS